MKQRFVWVLSLLCTYLSMMAQPKLTFQEGKFKMMQLTDLHWEEGSEEAKQTATLIRNMIAEEKPALVVLTGDIVTAHPAKEGWVSIIRLMEKLAMPFVVTMGNHDAEFMSKEDIYNLLIASPYYVGEKGEAGLTGMGNCVLPISTAEGKDGALLYFLDSNDYQPIQRLGQYNWIQFDQILWYRRTSEDFTKRNAGKPLPALAFFHIPLREYFNVLQRKDFFGTHEDDGIWAANINSGMFAAFVEKGDVMGMFVGHDHANDWIGLEAGLAVGYGRCSGWNAGSSIERGVRLFELYPGETRFNTWIRTAKGKEPTYYYPSALTSHMEDSMTYLPALKVSPTQQGVAFHYYEGKCKQLSDVQPSMQKKEGVMPYFSIDKAEVEDHFAFTFKSYIRIDQKGVYRFYTYSDDGSKLLIDGKLIVDNDGGHGARRREGIVALEAGWHKIEVPYFENYMGQVLEIGYVSKFFPECLIPQDVLFVHSK